MLKLHIPDYTVILIADGLRCLRCFKGVKRSEERCGMSVGIGCTDIVLNAFLFFPPSAAEVNLPPCSEPVSCSYPLRPLVQVLYHSTTKNTGEDNCINARKPSSQHLHTLSATSVTSPFFCIRKMVKFPPVNSSLILFCLLSI